MPDDANADAVWRFLVDRTGRRPGAGAPGSMPRADFSCQSKARLLNAAVGILAATRELLEVTEDVLKERRDNLATMPPSRPSSESPSGSESSPPTRIDLSY